ncbi:MAG: hypothetical protein EXR71_02360 [Myxococcales bacterium]|nr:hypothetical protein [Myxococcales bacterium]
MDSIAAVDSLRPGDVVHHPAFGFATITAVDARGAQVRWARDPTAANTNVSRHSLSTTYRRCRSAGVLARHLTEPEAVRRLAADDPVALLGLLLVDLGGGAGAEDVREWGAQLMAEENFAGWWGAVLVLAGVDGRFLIDDDAIGLAPGVTESDFTEPSALAEPEIAADVSAIPLAPGSCPTRQGAETWDSAEALAAALAALHARGDTLLRQHDACRPTAQGWSLRVDPEAAPPSQDVRWACRRLIEELLGTEIPPAVADHELVDLAPAAEPTLPPELLGVLRYGLARDPSLRPADGIALAHSFAIARAVWTSRATLPSVAHAELVAGFDTHIGTFKSLAGQTNQDSFLLLGEPEHALVMVADGISTATAGSGDLASSLAACTMRLQWSGHHEALRRATATDAHCFLTQALDRANRVVAEAAVRLAGGDLSRHVPMGTTVVAGVTVGDTVHLAALGDSRAYVVGRHGVAPVLWDQNVNAIRLRQVAASASITWDERGYALVGYLGHFDELGQPSLAPLILRSVRLLPGEWLILATDGLSDHAADEEAGVYKIIERLCAEEGTRGDVRAAMRLARRLVLAANDGTGGDNVTVLALTSSGVGRA